MSRYYCADAALLRRDLKEKKAKLTDVTLRLFEITTDSSGGEVELQRRSDISAELKT